MKSRFVPFFPAPCLLFWAALSLALAIRHFHQTGPLSMLLGIVLLAVCLGSLFALSLDVLVTSRLRRMSEASQPDAGSESNTGETDGEDHDP